MNTLEKSKAFRSQEYLMHVRSLACECCGNTETAAHHESLNDGKKGVGLKVPDTYAIPLCHACHQKRHDKGVDTFWGIKKRFLDSVMCITMLKFLARCSIDELRKCVEVVCEDREEEMRREFEGEEF